MCRCLLYLSGFLLIAGTLCAQTMQSSPPQEMPTDGQRATYEAAVTAKTSVAGCSFFLEGSSTKTVRITRLVVSYISTSTTLAYHDVTLQRYSALSGGTNNTVTSGKLDTNDAAATATVDQVSTVNSTQTTVGGVLRGEHGTAQSSTVAAASLVQRMEWDFGDKPLSRAATLRGTSDYLCVVFDAATATYDAWAEWIEDNFN